MIDVTDASDAGAATPPVVPERLLEEVRVLHAVSERLLHLRDAEALAHDVIALLRDVVAHDFAAIYLVDGDRLKTFAVTDRGLGPEALAKDKAYFDSLDLRVGKNVTGWVAAHGESLIIGDTRHDPRFLDSQPGVLSELCVPLRSRDRVTGVINMESYRTGAYSEDDRRLLEIAANQIAIAIDNAALLERTRDFERLKMHAELTGGLAHDLGNLLQVALGNHELLLADLAEGEMVDPDQAERTGVALGKAVELSRGLLNLGRPQTATDIVVDLDTVLGEATPLLEMLAGVHIDLTVQHAQPPCPVRGDAAELEQVLMNVAVNACQAMPDGGELSISTVHAVPTPGAAGGTVRLQIRDTGSGMDAETAARALEPYFTTRPEGTGLGLSTVARIVDKLGGRIAINSTPGVGTTVSVVLPLAAPPGGSAIERANGLHEAPA